MRQDAAIGVVFAGAFALGIALLSLQRSYAIDLSHILFGNLLGVSTGGLWLAAGLGLAVLVVVTLFYKEFLVLSFDPVLATTLRLPVGFLENLLLVLIALVIVTSIQAVGVALVLAMLVTPASAAYLVTRRLPVMMALASGSVRWGSSASPVVCLNIARAGDCPWNGGLPPLLPPRFGKGKLVRWA
jgi:ABC-type Mn2+/Zn2+ transport system permease subunit